MIRMTIALTLVISMNLVGCVQINKSNEKQDINSITNIDTSKIAVLPLDTETEWIFNEGKPTELTTNDLQKIEAILNKCIDEYNEDQKKSITK